MRKFGRYLATALVVVGLLLAAEAAVTVLYGEPITAYLNKQDQQELEDQFTAIAQPPAPTPPVKDETPEPEPEPVDYPQPKRGEVFGKLTIPALDVSAYAIEGTRTEDLSKGPGHLPYTEMPGERGTVAIAGHRTTYGAWFRNVDQLEGGDKIILKMPYGTYVYKVERVKIVDPDDVWVTRNVRFNRLVLSACHPVYSAAQRIIVFARFDHVRGVD